jgi:hypothetical protein
MCLYREPKGLIFLSQNFEFGYIEACCKSLTAYVEFHRIYLLQSYRLRNRICNSWLPCRQFVVGHTAVRGSLLQYTEYIT